MSHRFSKIRSNSYSTLSLCVTVLTDIKVTWMHYVSDTVQCITDTNRPMPAVFFKCFHLINSCRVWRRRTGTIRQIFVFIHVSLLPCSIKNLFQNDNFLNLFFVVIKHKISSPALNTFAILHSRHLLKIVLVIFVGAAGVIR